MQTSNNLVEEILDLSEDLGIDLIVMASSKVTSPIMGVTSITRKVIDGQTDPYLLYMKSKDTMVVVEDRKRNRLQSQSTDETNGQPKSSA